MEDLGCRIASFLIGAKVVGVLALKYLAQHSGIDVQCCLMTKDGGLQEVTGNESNES